MLQGGYRLMEEQIGRLTPGQILQLVFSDRSYAHNQASLIAYHMRSAMGVMSRRG